MPKRPITQTEITFRKATPEDARIVAPLIYETFPRAATFLIGLSSEEQARQILEKLFVEKGHRLNYEVTGAMVTYPGRDYNALDRKLNNLVQKQYRFRGKVALLIRAWPTLLINDIAKDEYLLGHLAVRNRYRGKGVGTAMLAHVEDRAREAGFSKVALKVAIEKFYLVYR